MSDERRRLEAKIQQLEEELDEEQANTETLSERLRRSVQEVIGVLGCWGIVPFIHFDAVVKVFFQGDTRPQIILSITRWIN